MCGTMIAFYTFLLGTVFKYVLILPYEESLLNLLDGKYSRMISCWSKVMTLKED